MKLFLKKSLSQSFHQQFIAHWVFS